MTDAAHSEVVGPLRLPLHKYLFAWTAYQVLIHWPLAFYDRAPSRLHGWAWGYAMDQRQFPKDPS